MDYTLLAVQLIDIRASAPQIKMREREVPCRKDGNKLVFHTKRAPHLPHPKAEPSAPR